MKRKQVKFKLLRVHYLNAIRKRPGSIIRLDEAAAKLLESKKVGRIEGEFPALKARAKRK